MNQSYINECKQIQQNCTYTAEAHHIIAITTKWINLIFQIVPAAISAIITVKVANGSLATSYVWYAAIGAAMSAVAVAVNPNESYQTHRNAAKSFTILKHDARFLYETTSKKMSEDAFAVAAENLHNRYNDLVRVAPPTGPMAFWWASRVVKKGIHQPDKDDAGKIL